MPYANNKGTNQPAHPRSLISILVVRCLDSIIPILAKSKISRLASFCSWAGRFESYLVANPKDRFSHDMAQIMWWWLCSRCLRCRVLLTWSIAAVSLRIQTPRLHGREPCSAGSSQVVFLWDLPLSSHLLDLLGSNWVNNLDGPLKPKLKKKWKKRTISNAY